jgi:hypothetical protein
MRPTIDEQLSGAQRLLDLVESSGDLSPGSAELLRNAQRLIRRVAASWSTTLPFLLDDNTHLAALLHQDPPGDTERSWPERADDTERSWPERADDTDPAARNDELRGVLARLIRELPADAEGRARRTEIGHYLRRRVAADPT